MIQHTRKTFCKTAFAFVSAVLLCFVKPTQAQMYAIKDLGTLGGTTSIAYSINASGHVVGSSASRAFLHNGTAMLNLGTLGGESSYATGANASDQVVGVSYTSGGDAHAFLFSGGIMKDLSTLGGSRSGMFSLAYAINASGQVVGYSLTPSNDGHHAFLYDASGMTDLGTLNGSGSDTYSYAYAINSSGQVAGASRVSNGAMHAFLFSEGTMKDLGTLSGPGGIGDSWAYGINASGLVVGTSHTTNTVVAPTHAFLYDASNALNPMKDLDTLYGGTNSTAVAINAFGHVVGLSGSIHGNRPFLYDGKTMRDLNDLLPSGSGWTLMEVRGINDSGQIAGTGIISGQTRAFLLTPISLTSISVSPSTVPGCKTAIGKVTLKFPAVHDTVITLASTHPAATVPESVTVLAGKTTATFNVTTSVVTTVTKGYIKATLGAVTRSALLTVRPIGVASVSLTPNPVVSGNEVTGRVTLECPAAPDDIPVVLSSSNPAVANPTVSSLTIPFNTSTATFTVQTGAVTVSTSVRISATANGITKSATLTVKPVVLESLTLAPNPVTGGLRVTGILTLVSPAAPGGTRVTLTSSRPEVVSVPDAVTLPEGFTAVTFTADTSSVSAPTVVTIKAAAGGVTKTVALRVRP